MLVSNIEQVQTIIDLMSKKNDVNKASFKDIKVPYDSNFAIDFKEINISNICNNKELIKSLENAEFPIYSLNDDLLKAIHKYEVNIEKMKLLDGAKFDLLVADFLTPQTKYQYLKKMKIIEDFSYIVSNLYITNEAEYPNEVFDLSMIDITNCNFQTYAVWDTIFGFNMSEILKDFCKCFENISKERLDKIYNIWGNFYSIFLVCELTEYYKAIHYLENPHLLPKQLQPNFLKSAAMNQEFSFLKDTFDEESKEEMGYFLKKLTDEEKDENLVKQYENVYFAFEMQYAIDNN